MYIVFILFVAQCGRPRNARLTATKKGSVTITWDAPIDTDRNVPSRFMWYNVIFAAEDDNTNQVKS